MQPGRVIRSRRLELGLRQDDLAERLGVTQAFISQMERGAVTLPGDDVRVALKRELGVDPFADRAAKRAGKLSLGEATRRLRAQGIVITEHGLSRLIQTKRVRAHKVHRRGLGRYHVGYEIDENELAEDIAALPPCRFGDCDAPATSPSGCCGEHGQKHWAFGARGSKRPPEVRAKISAAQRGRPRPDTAERMRRWHEDIRAMVGKLRAERDLVSTEDIAARRGVRPHSILAGYASHGLTPVVRRVAGHPRLLFRAQDVAAAPWAPRGERGRQAWRVGDGVALWKITFASGRVRRSWNRIWWLDEVRELGRRKKGEKAASEILSAAVEVVRLSIERNGKQPTRPELIRALIRHIEGEGALYHEDGSRRQGRDPVFCAARAKVNRRLASGFRRFGVPPALSYIRPHVVRM